MEAYWRLRQKWRINPFCYAKLKVKGFSNGFLHPIAKIPCENESIHGSRQYRCKPRQSWGCFGLTKGLMARSIREISMRDVEGEVEAAKLRSAVDEGSDAVVRKG